MICTKILKFPIERCTILRNYKKMGFNSFIKVLVTVTIILILGISFSEAAEKKDKEEKDCIYCKKYETMEDWPEKEKLMN